MELMEWYRGLWSTNPECTSTPETEEDRTLSPYFHVQSDDPDLDSLPLEATSVETRIAGAIAEVRVRQTYRNAGRYPLEAVYVFPASTRAAVHALQMTIGERIIVCQVHRRERARQEYEQACDQGQSAALLEQQRPNVLQMNVANIMPGDRMEVELGYTELLVPTGGVYEFAYPAVVGPRYSDQPADMAPEEERWIANPYLRTGETTPCTFDMRVALHSGVPIQEVACRSHAVEVEYEELERAVIRLADGGGNGGDRDFVLRYRLQGRQIHSGLMLHEGGHPDARAAWRGGIQGRDRGRPVRTGRGLRRAALSVGPALHRRAGGLRRSRWRRSAQRADRPAGAEIQPADGAHFLCRRRPRRAATGGREDDDGAPAAAAAERGRRTSGGEWFECGARRSGREPGSCSNCRAGEGMVGNLRGGSRSDCRTCERMAGSMRGGSRTFRGKREWGGARDGIFAGTRERERTAHYGGGRGGRRGTR